MGIFPTHLPLRSVTTIALYQPRFSQQGITHRVVVLKAHEQTHIVLTLRLSRRRPIAGTSGVGWLAFDEAITTADPRDTQVKALQFFFYAESKGVVFR